MVGGDLLDGKKIKKRSNSPQSNTSSLIDTTSFNDSKLFSTPISPHK
jgi:hypothetical protein